MVPERAENGRGPWDREGPVEAEPGEEGDRAVSGVTLRAVVVGLLFRRRSQQTV